MKQHITLEQAKELTEEQLCNLNTIMGHEWDITITEFHKMTWNKICEDTAKFCTIGKMIEILEKELKGFDMRRHNIVHIGYTIGELYPDGKYNPRKVYSSPSWLMTNHTSEENDKYKGIVLCDSLWEAVKEVL